MTDGYECCCCVRWRSEEGTQAMRVRVADCVIHQHGRRGDCLSAADSSRQRLLELPHQCLHHQSARQHRRHDGGESLSITGKVKKESKLGKRPQAFWNVSQQCFTGTFFYQSSWQEIIWEYIVYPWGGFAQNLRKWSKYVTFFICLSHVLRFKKFLVVNDTGYNFCVL